MLKQGNDSCHLQPWIKFKQASFAHYLFPYVGTRADSDPGGLARIFLLSERRSGPGADKSRSWQIEALSEKSAEEELEELVGAHNWPAALDLAREHGLSTDPVHKCDPHIISGLR